VNAYNPDKQTAPGDGGRQAANETRGPAAPPGLPPGKQALITMNGAKDMKEITGSFQIEGRALSCERYGNGHINETYLLRTDRPHDYILQKINSRVFHDVPALMDNIIAVTDHLRKQNPDPRQVLTLVPTTQGLPYLSTQSGEYWRLYEFITDSICLEKPESAEDLRQSGVAFGDFQNRLADFPSASLTETIPRFHDTPDRYRLFHVALREDRARRLETARQEIDSYLAREAEAAVLMDLRRRGELPLRVTHNDTKLNNVMLDAATRTPLCVIDLDTVMPGLAANDFGDSIRFGASTAAEDERDLDRVELSLALYGAYAEGFLRACGKGLTKTEIDTLPHGVKLMTLECGVRFLTDYLNGDTYFHTSRPGQNLDRARTQIKLVSDMEKKWDAIRRIIDEQIR